MSTNKLKVYLIAGEPSGDLLGSRLMKAFWQKLGDDVEFFGIGGDTMEATGFKSLFDISDLAVMGLFEVIPSIPKVLSRIKETVDNIKRIKPDVVITIDSWSFSARVHKAIRKENIKIPQVHYVAPQVWAWKKKRAKTMYKYIDLLLTLLPTEPKYFTPYNLETKFVGHPVIESDVANASKEDFYKKFGIAEDKRIISILPGSRKTEVSKLLPIFIDAAKRLNYKYNNLVFALPTVKTVSKLVKKMLKHSGLNVILLETEQDRYNAFKASDFAIAASGTVALELAIAETPHLVAYKVSPLTAFIIRKIANLKYVNLSNIILDAKIVPELLQEDCIETEIYYTAINFLDKKGIYNHQVSRLPDVKKELGFGQETPSKKAVDEILNFIKK